MCGSATRCKLFAAIVRRGANLQQLKQDIVAKEKEIQPMVQKDSWQYARDPRSTHLSGGVFFSLWGYLLFSHRKIMTLSPGFPWRLDKSEDMF